MSAKRWYVGAEDGGGTTLGWVLERLGEARAHEDGRAFVDRRRVLDGSLRLSPGSVVEVWAPRAPDAAERFEVLAVRGDWLVAHKPATLPTTADHRGATSLVESVAAWLSACGRAIVGPPHPVSRLDVGVSGAVLFALTHEARKALDRAPRFQKLYVGVAKGHLEGSETLHGAIGKASHDGRRRAALSDDGRASSSRLRAIATARDATLLELEPITGRTHQLRLHLEARGAPLYGDRAHGGAIRVVSPAGAVRELKRIMLHARRVELALEGVAPLVVDAPVPASMRELWSSLDGDPSAWNALEPSATDLA